MNSMLATVQLILLIVVSLSSTFDPICVFFTFFHHRYFTIHPAAGPHKHMLWFSKWIKNVVKIYIDVTSPLQWKDILIISQILYVISTFIDTLIVF